MYSTPITNTTQRKSKGETLNFSTCMNRSRMSVWSDMFSSFLPRPEQNEPQNGIQTILCLTVAILLSVTILLLLSQIYFIFMPCLKSLLWALLLGSAIYRFKAVLCYRLQVWLDSLIVSDCSLLSGLIRLPFDSVGNTYQDLVEFISHNKVLFLLFHFRVQLWKIAFLLSSMSITVLQHNHGIITFFIIFGFTVQVMLVLSRHFTKIFSLDFLPTIVLLLMFYLLQFLGIFGLLIQVILVLIFVWGFIKTGNDFFRNNNRENAAVIVGELKQVISLLNSNVKAFLKKILDRILDKCQNVECEDSQDSSAASSQEYFKLLFTLTGFMISEQLGLSNVVLIVYCVHLIVTNLLKTLYEKSKQCFSISFEFFSHVFSKLTLLASNKIQNDIFFQIWSYFFLKGDKSIQKSIQNRLDLIASAGIICAMFLAGIFFSIFLSVMIYGEFYSVANLAQKEISKIDFIRDRLNVTFVEYTNRDYLNGLIKSHLTGKLNLKAEDQDQLNEMLLEFGKNLLALFNSSQSVVDNNNSTLIEVETFATSQYSFYENLHILKSIFSKKYFVKEFKNFNYEAMFAFLNSKANSLLPLIKAFSSIVYTLIFLILDSSSIVLGFILNFIIFVLALFYLLLTSRNKYRPMEILDGILGCSVIESQSSPSQYMGEVVNSIFAATLKLSLFYGIYTWLLHSLFELKICFIPAVIAALLGAVPILHAYWASFPTVLYIYWFDPIWPVTKSVGFAALAIAPSFVVDSSIYSDIKRSGHPYLTGLAITCGIVYYGFEGALFGPLWLCFLFILLHLFTLLSNNAATATHPPVEVFHDATAVLEKTEK